MGAPRTGIGEIEDINIKTFGCYPGGTIISASSASWPTSNPRSRQRA